METAQNTNQGKTQIAEVFGPVTVDNVKEALANQKGEITKHRAQLRQELYKTYPSGKAHDSMTDPLFALEEFGFTEGNKYTEKRVTWIDVPIGTTMEEVKKRIDACPSPRLVRHLSLNPILTSEQAQAIQNGIISLETIAANQVVRDQDENPVPYKGYLQYRVVKFSAQERPDIDTREKDYADFSAKGVEKPFQMASATSVLAKQAGQAATANVQQ